MVNRKVVPPLGLLFASIVPPWASTRFFAMASPRPAPPVVRAREGSARRNLSNTVAITSSGMPSPVSSTATKTSSVESVPALHGDLASLRGVPDGVLKQVVHHLENPGGVHSDGWDVFVYVGA